MAGWGLQAPPLGSTCRKNGAPLQPTPLRAFLPTRCREHSLPTPPPPFEQKVAHFPKLHRSHRPRNGLQTSLLWSRYLAQNGPRERCKSEVCKDHLKRYVLGRGVYSTDRRVHGSVQAGRRAASMP